MREVSPEAMKLLSNYTWPGNLRELQSVLKHAVVEANGPVVVPEFLPETVREADNPSGPTVGSENDLLTDDGIIRFIHKRIKEGTETLYDDVIQRVERILLMELLQEFEGNISRASALLGISRSTLRTKLAALGINLDRSVRMNE